MTKKDKMSVFFKKNYRSFIKFCYAKIFIESRKQTYLYRSVKTSLITYNINKLLAK